MDYNYHTHTYRCHHASGTIEEYVKRAIEGGIKYMGFSDHLPLICSDGTEVFYRVSVSEVDDYVSEISEIREKYKDMIDLKIGFEMEYYPDFFENMLKNAIKWGGEYLILGEHFIEEENPDIKLKSVRSKQNTPEKFIKYADCVIDAMKSGVFSYIAHPDIFYFDENDKIYDEQMRRICKASNELDVPLEINFLGIREGREYPKEKFWQIAGEEKSPVTFGFDAHDVLNAFDDKSLVKAKEMVRKFNLNYIGKPQIIDIRKVVL